MKNLILLLTFAFSVFANAAIVPADKAELGERPNYILNGGAERGTAGFAKYFDGQTFTVTIASPGVFTTSSAHNLVVGDKVYLTTTGSLPTGLSTGTAYYVSVVGSSTTFQLATAFGGSSINTSGTQSGTHTFRPYAAHAATGGTASHLTLSSTTSSPLAGNRSLTIANSGSSSAMGEGVSYPFTLETSQKGKIQEITFDHQLTSGTFQTGSLSNGTLTDSDLEVYVWDVTNSAIIIPSRIFVDCGSSTSSLCSFSTTFTASSSSTSYRLAFHVGTTNTNAWTMKFDNIKVRPYQTGFGGFATDWQSYTPTYTGMGAVTNSSLRWRRVGGSMEIQGSFTTGTVTGVTAAISLPSGYAVDGGFQVIGGGLLGHVGHLFSDCTGCLIRSVLTSANATTLNFSVTSSGSFQGLHPQTGSGMFNSNENDSMWVSVPISGWSASSTAVRADNSNFGWTDGGAIGLTSTGGGVVKGTTSIDKIRYRRNGENLDVHIEYKQTATGTVGTGDYLFAIPSVCTADTTKISTFTTVADTRGGMALPNSSVFFGNSTNVGVGVATLYDSSHIRIQGTTNAGASVLEIGQGFFGTADTNVFYGINYSVPCSNWSENQMVPLLVGTVFSNTGGQERIERAVITNNGTTCAVSSQSGSWISSVVRNGADKTCNTTIASGMFSSAPVCTCVCNGSGAARFCTIATDGNNSATAQDFQCNTGAATVDNTIYVQCMGPR